MTAATRPTVVEAPVSLTRLWLAIAAGPVLWSLVEVGGYAMVGRACDHGVNGLNIVGLRHAPTVLVVMAGVGALLTVWALIVAVASLRAIRSPQRAPDDPRDRHALGSDSAPWTRAHFMAFAGVLSSAIFLLGFVLMGIPPFLLQSCSMAR